ncbi:hypothetical protein L7F22_046899 [Adiantum nelumboides]|nr:hypothetical protein [Adiantum nelumboides]
MRWSKLPEICEDIEFSLEDAQVDIDVAWDGVKQALRPCIHTFIATSEIHMQYKLHKSPDEVVKIARDMVVSARRLGCEDIEFSLENAGT